ncbi:hypothetical protein BJ546DRAFT_355606 [Cryomyces antarcticus]|uniref:Uncharacterized protein n=1 Tax=Cryomyces antarcticus TaxID=329879 RepID=A0ABR0LPF7_9PEZI|nr:hypothetical protein LTR39_002223 [Cryomyces antarcticus]KAK5017875.1 hypothetical protein LTR60_001744 [Cryomyces antarcticus]KAK5201454.1 hypothetical protein LTR16_002611 [Cryomyces antarcticus]
MHSITQLLLVALSLSQSAVCWPHEKDYDDKDGEDHKACNNTLPSLYTLTAYKKHDGKYNGMKVESGGGLYLGRATASTYCPDQVRQAGGCPPGIETVFGGTMSPVSEVPGGQDLYVAYDGSIEITVQHSHTFPPNSYPYYVGWTWTAFTCAQAERATKRCVKNNAIYDCSVPTGYFNFKSPDEAAGGIMACPPPDGSGVSETWQVFAVTPGFVKQGCVKLDGLATHAYTGVVPPVWAY